MTTEPTVLYVKFTRSFMSDSSHDLCLQYTLEGFLQFLYQQLVLGLVSVGCANMPGAVTPWT